MPSFSDSIFLFLLALLLFGPKKLPVLARELGKWIGEFRRASNEFKMQMEEELRQSEQADRQKQIAAMEAAAPLPPSLDSEPEHPHLRDAAPETSAETAAPAEATESAEAEALNAAEPLAESRPAPLPIASSGSLNIMPPSTGLPTPRGRGNRPSDPLGSLVDSIPEDGNAAPDRTREQAREEISERIQETAAHG